MVNPFLKRKTYIAVKDLQFTNNGLKLVIRYKPLGCLEKQVENSYFNELLWFLTRE